MIIFLAGLQGIPAEYYDAASVDGAGAGAAVPAVTLPLLTPSIFFTGMLAPDRRLPGVRPGVRDGAPGQADEATITLVYFIYEAGFRNFKMGYASAASWVLFLIVAVAHDPLLPDAATAGCTTSERARERARSVRSPPRAPVPALVPPAAHAVLIAGGL